MSRPAPYYSVAFADDPDAPLQRELDRLYDYAGDHETRILHRSRLNLFAGLLESLAREGVPARRDRALDVGCNAGVYSRMLSDAGFADVLGIDIDEEQVRRAVAAFASDEPGCRIAFRVENAERLEADAAYDFILCTEVIEHTTHPGLVVANLKRALRPGGIAVVTLPNACSLPFAKAALKYRFVSKHRDPVFEDHLRYPFWRALSLFSDGALAVRRVTGTNLVWDATTLRWLRRSSVFPALHRAQFELGRAWPFCHFAQFFFMVLERRA